MTKKITNSELRKMVKNHKYSHIFVGGNLIGTALKNFNYEKIAYNSGIFGWNYSVFENKKSNNLCVLGYRNIPLSGISINSLDELDKYEKEDISKEPEMEI